MNLFTQKKFANNLWNISGNFGELNTIAEVKENGFFAENDKISVISEITKHENGVFVRRGKVKNICNEDVFLNTLASKFMFDGGEYEVYSQANNWQNESEGEWQPLVTSVSARSKSVRNASGASPFIVLWSKQAGRGTAFHINAYSAWEMRLSRIFGGGEITFIEAELGVLSEGLSLTLAPGEEINLPEIIYYDVFNKTDLDCFKLHSYLNKNYPRKTMPVIYNSWLYKFDRFSFEDIEKQIAKASELGVEYFVIDAGWFGEGCDWWPSRGDWEENLTFGFKGRMCEIAQKVRAYGMKFGFWLEPESASASSNAVKNNPDYFLQGPNSYFIDFANDKAMQYIFDKTCSLIDRYGAEFVKFDFNADLNYDKYHSSFLKYCKGHDEFIKMLKEKYPDLYIENCASGGMRMSVRDGMLYDSFWPSDNQSPYFGLRIFKDSILRLPPQWLEAWVSLLYAENLVYSYRSEGEFEGRLISIHDATWTDVIGVDQSFLNGFLTGHPIGLTFDLTLLNDETFNNLKTFISNFKKNRDFWKNAVCHILSDTDSLITLEFCDADYSKVEIVVFSKKIKQQNISVYPILSPDASYENIDGEIKSAKEIWEDGITIENPLVHTANFITLKKRR